MLDFKGYHKKVLDFSYKTVIFIKFLEEAKRVKAFAVQKITRFKRYDVYKTTKNILDPI